MTATNLKNCPMDDHRLILRAIAFGVSRLVPRHGKHCTNRYPPGFPPWQLWINDRTPSDVGDGEYVPRSFKLNDDGHGTPKLSDDVRALLVENMRRFESVPPHTRAAPPAPGEALPSVEELDDLFVSVVAEGGSTRDAVAAIRHRCLQSKPPVEADVGELERLEREATPGPWSNDGSSFSDFGREFQQSMSMEFISNGAERDRARARFDVAFIVALRNAAPALFAELRALRAGSKPRTTQGERNMLTNEQIARVCHEVNRAYCLALGDTSQPAWEDAPEWQRSSALNGVQMHVDDPHAGPQASHEGWMREKVEAGWAYGPVKDPAKKEHPCIVPFDQLPREQQAKDYIFRSIVHALRASRESGNGGSEETR